MSIRPILTFPNSLLRKRAKPVKEIDSDIMNLIKDMKDTLTEASGVGLAANQVGVLKRVVVILNSPESDIIAYINPEITNRNGKRDVPEGCLSFPGYSGIVTRSISVTARYMNESGGKIKITANELLSQALEHEIDHLNGILFLDHLKEHEKLSESNPEYRPHTHDINVSVKVQDDQNKTEFNKKLYTKVGIDDLKFALERADILKDVEQVND
ncbi:MAG: peptide deformylase [Chloroflexota bacterium]|nr:peptide deformylase [Chloroflexota bacterium]